METVVIGIDSLLVNEGPVDWSGMFPQGRRPVSFTREVASLPQTWEELRNGMWSARRISSKYVSLAVVRRYSQAVRQPALQERTYCFGPCWDYSPAMDEGWDDDGLYLIGVTADGHNGDYHAPSGRYSADYSPFFADRQSVASQLHAVFSQRALRSTEAD